MFYFYLAYAQTTCAVGCYNDPYADDMLNEIVAYCCDSLNTAEKCLATCKNLGYTYAGVYAT